MTKAKSETATWKEAKGGALVSNILLLKIGRCEKSWQEVKYISEGAQELHWGFVRACVYLKIAELKGQ